ncbi:MAG: caspase family protein [Saprospiraceae bacterium]
MRTSLVILALLLGLSLSAQQKSIKPLPVLPAEARSAKASSPATATRAVVIGISDYQDPQIPDLRFADRDAEAFANFLRSPAGGSLDGDHLKVLTNSKATVAQFAIALDWLMENSKEGDQAIIYFSGHGDVEKKTLTQPGFLLCWDAPARVYMAGGTFALPMLQEVISTLSIQNKSKVVVIADACRSGTLSGNSIGGAQATASNLARQYANEIKVLSCQPNEYSIEGEQWGGGRGAFSFNLVDALYGLADHNNDLFVTLQEIGRYLEDHVTAEVAPISQVPMILGNRSERLADVDRKLLADLRSGKTTQMALLSPVESKGLEEDVLAGLSAGGTEAGVDTNVRELYRRFKQSLKDKVFLEPATACADVYYERLIQEPKLIRLHSTMRRNYAAALQDDAQQVMNTMLKTGLTIDVLSGVKPIQLYQNYPAYLNRAAELLDSGHYMYATLQARKSFFEGKIQPTLLEKRKHFLKALDWQPELPHAFVEMVSICSAIQLDSAILYATKAMEISPTWVVPYIRLATFYDHRLNKPGNAEALLNQAGELDSSSLLVWYQKANFYSEHGNFGKAEYWFKKTIASADKGICFPCAQLHLGYGYNTMGRYAEAVVHFLKAIQLDSSFTRAYNGLGTAYRALGRFEEAE